MWPEFSKHFLKNFNYIPAWLASHCLAIKLRQQLAFPKLFATIASVSICLGWNFVRLLYTEWVHRMSYTVTQNESAHNWPLEHILKTRHFIKHWFYLHDKVTKLLYTNDTNDTFETSYKTTDSFHYTWVQCIWLNSWLNTNTVEALLM